ncbi:MAG: type II toxin-antitoxin system HicB family antitoxin [Mogibacterium sp.]|nr:type II toxin-antitoxin system HicB family antitoxin [Mogibacterium sp.]
MKYAYPAVMTPEESGYSVYFPDLEGCYTCGDDLADALYMAEDALALALFELERSKAPIPKPSELDAIALEPGEFVSYVCCDTIGYQKMHNNKAVKKTLSIPEWLNEAALAKGLNFSQILQDGLRAALNV